MFDKKSDYALNKREKNAIVYTSTTISFRLTRSDFDSEDEFQKWKKWSDGDYGKTEQNGRGFYDNIIPLDETLDIIGAATSIEELLFGQIDEAEHIRLYAAMLEQIKRCLTEKQYRRLWMMHVKKMPIEAIATHEGVSHQSVSESISAARKNIFVFLQKHPAKMPVFL